MNLKAREYLEARGYGVEGLSTEGEFFAVIAAKAAETQRTLEGKEFPQARAIIVEFCKGIIRAAENPPKSLGLGPEMDEALLLTAFVRLFADREQLEKFMKGSESQQSGHPRGQSDGGQS